MAAENTKKRKLHEGVKARARPTKRFRKQKTYSSGSSSASDDEETTATDGPVDTQLKSPRSKPAAKTAQASSPSAAGSGSEASVSVSGSEPDSDPSPDAPAARTKPKRHDPAAFASSLHAILSSKLSTSKRSDPVLARSKDALAASHELAESRLETRAKRKLRDEKRVASERGRIRDVLLGDRAGAGVVADGDDVVDGAGMTAAEIAEQERRLRKTAQRGVVKLFNAVRAAQVKGEEAAREMRDKGAVGSKRKEEKVGEMGRKAFLEFVGAGGV